MIKLIAAIDSHRGIANNQGIPWHLPEDSTYFRQHIKNATVIMGRHVYEELTHPFNDAKNYVLSHQSLPLRQGFSLVHDLETFIREHADETVWVLGGAQLYEQTLAYADELYVTQIEKDFSCTKFFPKFKDSFTLMSESPQREQNKLLFSFQIWRKK